MTTNKFAWDASELSVSQCALCRHKRISGAICAAFPRGIPDAILTGDHDHRKPYPGDSGIHFEEANE